MAKKPTKSLQTTAVRRVKTGTREMINPETGELEKVPAYEIREFDINFEKVWLGHLLLAMDCLGGKRKEVVKWILENRDQDNQIVATFQSIQSQCNVSKQTVATVMKSMQSAQLIRKIRNGLYMLNSDFIFAGKHEDRINVMFTYENTKENN